MDAPLLDERLEPVNGLLLVGGRVEDDGGDGDDEDDPDDRSKWLQCFDHEAGGWGRLGDMAMARPWGCGAAAVGAYLYAFGGEGNDVEEPGCMTMYNMASRRMEQAAKPPCSLQFCTGVQPGELGQKKRSSQRVHLQPQHRQLGVWPSPALPCV